MGIMEKADSKQRKSGTRFEILPTICSRHIPSANRAGFLSIVLTPFLRPSPGFNSISRFPHFDRQLVSSHPSLSAALAPTPPTIPIIDFTLHTSFFFTEGCLAGLFRFVLPATMSPSQPGSAEKTIRKIDIAQVRVQSKQNGPKLRIP